MDSEERTSPHCPNKTSLGKGAYQKMRINQQLPNTEEDKDAARARRDRFLKAQQKFRSQERDTPPKPKFDEVIKGGHGEGRGAEYYPGDLSPKRFMPKTVEGRLVALHRELYHRLNDVREDNPERVPEDVWLSELLDVIERS
jgi:hypothetical protein